MTPGETILDFDFGNHLWVVLSRPVNGEVVVVNLTSHGKTSCGDHCVVITSAEYASLDHDSCVYYRAATFNPVQPLDDAKNRGALRQAQPLTPSLLQRIQNGALTSRFTSARLREAIRLSL